MPPFDMYDASYDARALAVIAGALGVVMAFVGLGVLAHSVYLLAVS